jgi:colanic acid biosynthesis glycosyl transferase WcaI
MDRANSVTRPSHVLVVTPQYAPDFGPSAPIYTALCEDLVRLGCRVTAITAFPHYAKAEALYPRAGRFFEEEIRNGVRVIRTYVYTVPQSSLKGRLLYHASFNVFSTLAMLKAGKADIMIADHPTLWSGLPLLTGSVLGGAPFLYVVHDIYPDVLSRLGVLRNRRLLDLIGRVENFFYRRSARVTVLSEGFKDNLLHKGVPAGKIAVIPICVDTDFIRPLEGENELRARWGLAGKFVAMYAGNIGLSQGLETLLEAAKRLRDHSEIAVVIVGEGATKASLEASAARQGLDNVKFFPFLPRESVPLIYDLADVSLVLLKRDIVVESVPSKTYSIMAAARPFIATVDRNTEVQALADEARCGICVEPEDAGALAEAILRLSRDPDGRREMGRRGRQHVVERYSRQFGARQYLGLIRRHARQGRP